jgi:hypothetical protein
MLQCSFPAIFNAVKTVTPQHAYAGMGGGKCSFYPFTTGHHGPSNLFPRINHYPLYMYSGPWEIYK